MSDILNFILQKLAEQPNVPPKQVIDAARHEYGGDKVYIRVPRVQDVLGSSQDVARRHNVSRRTAQRWVRKL